MEPLQEEKSPTNRENGSGAKVGFFGKESLNNIDSGQVEVNSKLYWALKLASFGFPILLLNPGSKEPLSGHSWTQSMTTDEATIREWLTDSDANYGVCGGPNGVIIDVDVKHDKVGDRALSKIEIDQEVDECISTSGLIVTTPSGGNHYYLTTPFPVSNSHRFPGGIDTRGAHGYVVGPSCQLVEGLCKEDDVPGFYEVQSDEAPLQAPSWVVERLKQQGERDPLKDDAPVGELDAPDAVQRAIAFLKVCEPSGTYRTACSVIDFGISKSKCLELILEYWNERRAQPRTEGEIVDRINHAAKYRQEQIGSRSAPMMDAMDKLSGRNNDNSSASPAASKSSLRLLSEADQDALPKPEWLIPGVLERETLALIYGSQDSFKSFLALDICLSAAFGIMPWGLAGGKLDRPLISVFIAAEGAKGVAKVRRPAWRQKRELAKDAKLPFYLVNVMPRLSADDDVDALIEEIERIQVQPDLIVVDTMARAMHGLDENSVKDTGLVIAGLDRLKRHFKCTVIVVHHEGRTPRKGGRGSTNIPASFDAHFQVTREGESLTTIIENGKQKDGEPWQRPIRLKGDKVVFEAADGSISDSLVFNRAPALDMGLIDRIDLAGSSRVSQVMDALRLLSGNKRFVASKVLATCLVELSLNSDDNLATKAHAGGKDLLVANEMRKLQREARPRKDGKAGILGHFLASKPGDKDYLWHIPAARGADSHNI